MAELECLAYGVGQGSEGICLLLHLGKYRVLLDCGLTNVAPLLASFPDRPPADLVLCSHAHADHAEGLLALHRAYPQMPVYASEVTVQLLPLNWPNEPHLAPFCHALPWRSPVEFQEGLSAELWPAGHLPGAAAFHLTYTTPNRTYTIFYTGDYLLSNSRLVEGLPLEDLRGLRPDVLILDGSYGTARHTHRRQQENQLAERINRAIVEQHSVLLPTPTLGLGQELLMLLRSHHQFTGKAIDIWVDATIAAGCDAYLELLPHFPSTVQNFARHQSLFWDDRIRPYVRRLPPEGLPPSTAPCIVLTHRSSDPSPYCHARTGPWLLLLPRQPGQAESQAIALERGVHTSKALRTLLKSGRLTVDTYLLSEHCDGPGTTQLIHNLRPQHILFIHGSPTYLSDLAGLEELQARYHLHIPSIGTPLELPLGEAFLQPSPPDSNYEGELTELETIVTVTLPGNITADSRWQQFADTGLIEARWQGEELVLRGLSQRELLNQNLDPTAPVDTECCENCLYFRGQRCWSQASPLYGFKVTPEGFCPAFEAANSAETLSSAPDNGGDDGPY